MLDEVLLFGGETLPGLLREFELFAEFFGLRLQLPVLVGDGRDLLQQVLFFSGETLPGLLCEFELFPEFVFVRSKFLIEPVDLFLQDPVSFLKGRHHAFLLDDSFLELFVFLDQRRVVGRAPGQQDQAGKGDPDQISVQAGNGWLLEHHNGVLVGAFSKENVLHFTAKLDFAHRL